MTRVFAVVRRCLCYAFLFAFSALVSFANDVAPAEAPAPGIEVDFAEPKQPAPQQRRKHGTAPQELTPEMKLPDWGAVATRLE